MNSSKPKQINFIFFVNGTIAIFRNKTTGEWSVPSAKLDQDEFPESVAYGVLAAFDCDAPYAYNEKEVDGHIFTAAHVEHTSQIHMPNEYDAMVLVSPSMLIDALVDKTPFIQSHLVSYFIHSYSHIWPIPFDFGLAEQIQPPKLTKRFALVMINGRKAVRVYENDHFFQTLTIEKFESQYRVTMRNK